MRVNGRDAESLAKMLHQRVVARHGDAYENHALVCLLPPEAEYIYIAACIRADHEGVWGDYKLGTPPPQVLGEHFRKLMEGEGMTTKMMVTYMPSCEYLVAVGMVWARGGKVRVFPYWEPGKYTVDVAPKQGRARNRPGE